ncbi:hypothetical protein U1Q18_052526 [Sarracenia purpurea var. burkii]
MSTDIFSTIIPIPWPSCTFDFDSNLVQKFCACDSAFTLDSDLHENLASLAWLSMSKFNVLLQDCSACGDIFGSVLLLVTSVVGVSEGFSSLPFWTFFLFPVGFSLGLADIGVTGFGVLFSWPSITTLGRCFFLLRFCWGVLFRSMPLLLPLSGL